MWGGKLTFTTAMLFAIGLVVEFTIGGLSGVTHAVAPSDTQQTDTYYIVAHFHYVLFGGAVLGFFAGFYYWWPKVFGKCLSERLGKWNFALMIIGMNLTFGPMHIIGLQGQPRRMYQHTEARNGEGFFNITFWNAVASVGAFIIALGVLLFLINVWHTHRKAPAAPLDPWDARTLEWMTTNPPKEHNFDSLPEVHALDEFFHRKYEDVGEGDAHDLRKVATAEEILADMEAHADHHIHMPSPSYWPILVALALPFIGFGIIYNHLIAVVAARPARPGDVRLGDGAVGRRRLRLRPAASERRDRRGDGRERVMSTPTAPEDKTPGSGAPDLGNEPSDSSETAIETIDQIPMGGLPEPGPSTDDGAGGSGLTDMPGSRDVDPRRGARAGRHGHHRGRFAGRRSRAGRASRARSRRPACPTTRWACGCSSAPSACCSAV